MASSVQSGETERLQQRLQGLRSVSGELQVLIHRAQKRGRPPDAEGIHAETSLKKFTSWASRLRTAAPVSLPISPTGWPSAPLPAQAYLPFPTTQTHLPNATLRTSGRRAPPPELEVAWSSAGAAGTRVITLRCFSPATDILWTSDGTIPRPGNPSLRVVASGSQVTLSPGKCLYAVAGALDMNLSDVVIVTASTDPALQAAKPAPAGQEPAPGVGSGVAKVTAPAAASSVAVPTSKVSSKAQAQAQFRGSLAAMLGSDSEEESE